MNVNIKAEKRVEESNRLTKKLLCLLIDKGYDMELFISDYLDDDEKKEYIEHLETTCMCGNPLNGDSELECGVCNECR